jgi:hypothetical protein
VIAKPATMQRLAKKSPFHSKPSCQGAGGVNECKPLFSTVGGLPDNSDNNDENYVRSLTKSQPTRLLTTRLRIALAMGWTAYLLALAIRGIIRRGRTSSLLPHSIFFHGDKRAEADRETVDGAAAWEIDGSIAHEIAARVRRPIKVPSVA